MLYEQRKSDAFESTNVMIQESVTFSCKMRAAVGQFLGACQRRSSDSCSALLYLCLLFRLLCKQWNEGHQSPATDRN